MTISTPPAVDDAMPPRIAKLPRYRAYPVPWFVEWFDGTPDFRVADSAKQADATRFHLCWVCGERTGRHVAFVIGPMCAVNRVSAEPPCHTDCAVYSATHCPFLANPNMTRRERGLPADYVDPAGVMLLRNPGVALVWATRAWSTFRAPGGYLYDIGEPTQVSWFAHGRPATRDEVLASIDTGLPALREMADEDGELGRRELDKQLAAAMQLVPAATGATR
ncbi:MAG TPA: hypothetical protein VHX38_02910 [Pseudonocardiaceae bacterium]|jgi:hypothetical protein|nr:hypothetical protein [Pseudonocardiaceae bacterium]